MAMAQDPAITTSASRPPEPPAGASFPPMAAPPIRLPPAGYLPLPPPQPQQLFVWLDPAFLAHMDARRSRSLLQFMADEGALPSPEEDRRRDQVIRELQKVVMAWAKRVADEKRVPHWLVPSTTATIFVYGSYALGAHGPESDIDALCVGPCIASLQHHFFNVLRRMLKEKPEVSELYCVKNAKVPLMRFKFNGKLVDLPYVQLPVIDASEATIMRNPHLLQKVDEASLRSLSGVRVNRQIVQLVPNLKEFQMLLRCLKLWARRRGLHCHLLGFFAGIHLAILAAYVCRRHPNASLNTQFAVFFEIFAQWPWPLPVSLHDQPIHCWCPDGRSLMPIVMPCIPPEFCGSNITKSTFRKIKHELQRGYAFTKDLWRLDYDWSWLFAPFPYAAKYENFLRIVLSCPMAEELCDWAGWVKSRFRNLLLKLESIGVECDPDSSEEVDHTITEPNIVFYWGLVSQRSTHICTSSLKEEFVKCVTNDVYGKEKCTHSDLTMSIVGSSQLPKSMYKHSVYSEYLPWHTTGCQVTAQDCSAVG